MTNSTEVKKSGKLNFDLLHVYNILLGSLTSIPVIWKNQEKGINVCNIFKTFTIYSMHWNVILVKFFLHLKKNLKNHKGFSMLFDAMLKY